VTALDGTSNTQEIGYVKITLTPNAADVVNASSPMTVVVSPNALVLTATAAS
jgi:hypothetical protein